MHASPLPASFKLATSLAALLVAGAACGGQAAQAASRDADAKGGGAITLTNRVVQLEGGIGTGMIKSAQKKFLELDAQSQDPIWLIINSPGGSVDAGLILIDTFQALKSPVHCLVESKAYSMAAITLLFCDKKYALRHATIMLHEASYGTVGEDPTIRSRLEFITKYLDGVHHELAKRLRMSHEKYREKIRDAWWLMADEAQRVGVIDGVVDRIIYREIPLQHTEEKRTLTLQEKIATLPSELTGETIPKRRD
jgi:ATP-dependent Clp protease protease subunit